jgi:hypothetical protein
MVCAVYLALLIFSQLTFYINTATFRVSLFSFPFSVVVSDPSLIRSYLYNTCTVCVCVQIMKLFSVVIFVDSHI